MAIKRIESKGRKKSHRYDGKLGLWISYQVDVTARGKRHRPKFPTKAEAERYIDALRIQTAYKSSGLKAPASVYASIRLSHLFERRLKKIGREKERRNTETVFRRFREIVGFDAPVVEIEKPHFQQYINLRLQSVSAESVRREVTRLASAFRSAEEMFPVELEGYEAPPIKRPKGKRRNLVSRRTISEHEKDIIVAGLRDGVSAQHPHAEQAGAAAAAMFEIAWLLGFRYSEILGLKKANFNAKARRIRLRRFKTDTVTNFDFLPERAVELLKEMSERSSTEYIFELPLSSTGFEKALKRVCEANGIPYGRNRADGITFHSTRHSFTTRLVQVTDIATAASFTGHSDKEMVAYYSHASAASQRAAMRSMYGSADDKAAVRQLFERTIANRIGFDEFYQALFEPGPRGGVIFFVSGKWTSKWTQEYPAFFFLKVV